ncbi:TPA: hypothetical protein QFT23_005793 [Bacillus cereus]|nr:hypothetical protein [Bacillus cereus]
MLLASFSLAYLTSLPIQFLLVHSHMYHCSTSYFKMNRNKFCIKVIPKLPNTKRAPV